MQHFSVICVYCKVHNSGQRKTWERRFTRRLFTPEQFGANLGAVQFALHTLLHPTDLWVHPIITGRHKAVNQDKRKQLKGGAYWHTLYKKRQGHRGQKKIPITLERGDGAEHTMRTP